MTARPLDPESRRRPFYTAVVLIFLLSTMVFLGAPASAVTIHTNDGKLLISNGSLWIRWDPVGDHVAGDQFFVNGTTNIPAGNVIRYEFYSPVDCHVKYCDYSDSYREGSSTIGPGKVPGINEFSLQINTTGLKNSTGPRSDNYYLSFRVFPSGNSGGTGSFPGFDTYVTKNSKIFSDTILKSMEADRLSRAGSGNVSWITLDENIVSDRYPYTIPCQRLTGETNIPAGENLYYSVFTPDEFRAIDFHAGERILGGTVIPGDISGENKFNLTLNTTEFSEGRYLVIWNSHYNPSNYADSISSSAFLSTFPAIPVYNNSLSCPPAESGSAPSASAMPPSPASKAAPFPFGILVAITCAGLVVVTCRKKGDR